MLTIIEAKELLSLCPICYDIQFKILMLFIFKYIDSIDVVLIPKVKSREGPTTLLIIQLFGSHETDVTVPVSAKEKFSVA